MSLNWMSYGESCPPLNYQAQLSLLAPVKDPRHVDNRWDLLPIELKRMIVDMVNKPNEEAQKRYWKVRFRKVVSEVLFKMRCRNCGEAKISGLQLIRLGHSSLLCPMHAGHVLQLSQNQLMDILTAHWNDLARRKNRLFLNNHYYN